MSLLQLTTETFAIDEKLLGGNASAEGGEEGLESSNTTGVDIILNGELQEFSLDKKAYMKHIKEYMGRYSIQPSHMSFTRLKIHRAVCTLAIFFYSCLGSRYGSSCRHWLISQRIG